MGRRKSKRKPPPKKKNIEPLDQQFNCPFCNHEKSCEVKMENVRRTLLTYGAQAGSQPEHGFNLTDVLRHIMN
ncbi:PREDICTED: transcription elongation factor 1 homolog isoform X3 [Bactrocera latifrons]|uniref:transcription elongation factor 1 homolog isoform X3 n=1 Tax=Bactrocera latifrons TaxID=174628 RepID=UPI0008DDAB49|nr:PREDICTED: transcription elongation factor 1 homolog isoform X3 [Bactrocera latifrons]